MKNYLEKQANWYRPNFVKVDGVLYELSNIIFYNENGIICQTNYGYFENDGILEFDGEVTKRIKENLTRKENFILSDKKDYILNDKNYKLYIYEKNVKIKNTGIKKEYSFLYNTFIINDTLEINQYIRDLEYPKYKYQDMIKAELEKIKTYNLPVEENEMNEILKNIKKYNKKILEIKQNAKEYNPTTLENELEIKKEEEKENKK